MVDKIKDGWGLLKEFFATSIGWFVFGLIIGGFVSYIQYNRAEQLDKYLEQCSENERRLNSELKTAREDASKDFIRSFSEQVYMMQDLSSVLKMNNENTKQIIEQKEEKAKNDKKLINELKKKSNENS